MTETWKTRLLRAWRDERSPGEERRLLLLCFAAVFCWGLAAHAYGFFRASFTHDMLNALVVTPVETYWKMQLGRPGIVLYRRVVRGLIAAPWLIGFLSLIWLSLSCFLITKLFRVPGKVFPVLIAGILSVNISVTGMCAGFLYEMDANFFAMLCGVFAVLLWDRLGWKGSVAGLFFVTFCMGTYQSMVSVPVTLIMLLCIAALLRGERFAAVFRKGLTGVGMLAAGALLYFAAVRLMCVWKGINLTMDSYNRLGQGAALSVFGKLAFVYKTWAAAFWNPARAHIEPFVLVMNIVLPSLALVRLCVWMVRSKSGAAEKLLLALLLLLLPLGMNTAQLGFSMPIHDLMKYAFWLFELLWLLPFFLLPPLREGKALLRSVCGLLAALLLFSNVQTANNVYTKKDLEQTACLSLMTKVMYRVEEQPDYVPAETPLVFVGVSPLLNGKIPGFEDYYDIAGAEYSSPLVKSAASYFYNGYAAYLRYILNSSAVPADADTWIRLHQDPRVQSMPIWPAEGCIQVLDGVMVVRLGEITDLDKGDFS